MINRKQSGLTMISWMVIIGYLAIQAVLAMRIIPVYLNHNSLKTIMNEMGVDQTLKGMSGKKLSVLFRKRLKLNNLYDLSTDKEAFKFKKTKNGYHLTAKYETRGPILKNLSFVANFEHEVDINTH